MIWSQENRAAIRADLGNLTMPELSKELGRRWAALEVADRLTYEHKAKAAKAKAAESHEKRNNRDKLQPAFASGAQRLLSSSGLACHTRLRACP